MENALVHRVGDVDTLARHMSLLHEDRAELERLRAGALASAPEITWDRAGSVLLRAYQRASADRVSPNAKDRAAP